MKKLKKGFTLVEGVIALAVITIISASVTTLCLYGARTTPKLYAKFQASNIAADVVTCFNLSSDNSTFNDYLVFYVYGKNENNQTISVSNSDDDYTYNFNIENVSAKVVANFTDKTLNIATYYGTSEDELYSYSYSDSSGGN